MRTSCPNCTDAFTRRVAMLERGNLMQTENRKIQYLYFNYVIHKTLDSHHLHTSTA